MIYGEVTKLFIDFSLNGIFLPGGSRFVCECGLYLDMSERDGFPVCSCGKTMTIEYIDNAGTILKLRPVEGVTGHQFRKVEQ